MGEGGAAGVAARASGPSEADKFTAGYVNGVALAIFAVGGLAPPFAALYAREPPNVPPGTVLLIGLFCVAASVALHSLARRHLVRSAS